MITLITPTQYPYPVPVTGAEIATYILDTLRLDHADNLRWPETARHSVEYRMSTWPCGWTKDIYKQYFDTRAGLDSWIAATTEWAKLEDNEFAYQAYEWDWGPSEMKALSYDVSRLA